MRLFDTIAQTSESVKMAKRTLWKTVSKKDIFVSKWDKILKKTTSSFLSFLAKNSKNDTFCHFFTFSNSRNSRKSFRDKKVFEKHFLQKLCFLSIFDENGISAIKTFVEFVKNGHFWWNFVKNDEKNTKNDKNGRFCIFEKQAEQT